MQSYILHETEKSEYARLGGAMMQNERKRILTMLENGTITTDEALTLLEALGQNDKKKETNETAAPTVIPSQSSTEEEPTNEQSSKGKEHSSEDFIEELRKDFTRVGDRFMQFMQSAVDKVKAFDFESPFGQSTTIQHTITKPAAQIEEIIMDIDNGKVSIETNDEDTIRAEFTVKSYQQKTEEETKQEFLNKLLFVNDDGVLRIACDLKTFQVNMQLFIPKKEYAKLSARLLNGSFKWREGSAEKIQVKTANGKIEGFQLTCKDGEFETANGGISLFDVTGRTIEAEALNGRVYIDGAVRDVEAQSLNGHVVVTTTDIEAEKIEAKTVSGSVELYVPSELSLSGEISSNMGRLDLQLQDVDRTAEQEQLLQRSIRFKKDVEGAPNTLHLFGEAKTGSVLVCYNAKTTK